MASTSVPVTLLLQRFQRCGDRHAFGMLSSYGSARRESRFVVTTRSLTTCRPMTWIPGLSPGWWITVSVTQLSAQIPLTLEHYNTLGVRSAADVARRRTPDDAARRFVRSYTVCRVRGDGGRGRDSPRHSGRATKRSDGEASRTHSAGQMGFGRLNSRPFKPRAGHAGDHSQSAAPCSQPAR
jgi:hypothetical protein